MTDKVTVKENRAYVKGGGSCVNVDDVAFETRVRRKVIERKKDMRITELETQISEMKKMIESVMGAVRELPE